MNPFFDEMIKVAGRDDGTSPAWAAGGAAAGLGLGHVALGNTQLLPGAFLGDLNVEIKANGGDYSMVSRYANRKMRKLVSEMPAKDLRGGVYQMFSHLPGVMAESHPPVRTLATAGTVLAGGAIAGGIIAHAIGSHFSKEG